MHWPHGRDLDRLAASGTAVAHCPTVFQRRGIALRSFGRYRRAGVSLGIGTDTYPHNMIEEMRHALINSRLMSGDVFDLRTSDVFDAATVGVVGHGGSSQEGVSITVPTRREHACVTAANGDETVT